MKHFSPHSSFDFLIEQDPFAKHLGVNIIKRLFENQLNDTELAMLEHGIDKIGFECFNDLVEKEQVCLFLCACLSIVTPHSMEDLFNYAKNHLNIPQTFLIYCALLSKNEQIKNQYLPCISKNDMLLLVGLDEYQLIKELSHRGDLSVIKQILTFPIDDDHCIKDKIPLKVLSDCLVKATINGELKTLQFLLSNFSEKDKETVISRPPCNLAYHASKHNQLNILKYVLDELNESEKINVMKSSCLFTRVPGEKYGNLETFKFLLTAFNEQEIKEMLKRNNYRLYQDISWYGPLDTILFFDNILQTKSKQPFYKKLLIFLGFLDSDVTSAIKSCYENSIFASNDKSINEHFSAHLISKRRWYHQAFSFLGFNYKDDRSRVKAKVKENRFYLLRHTHNIKLFECYAERLDKHELHQYIKGNNFKAIRESLSYGNTAVCQYLLEKLNTDERNMAISSCSSKEIEVALCHGGVAALKIFSNNVTISKDTYFKILKSAVQRHHMGLVKDIFHYNHYKLTNEEYNLLMENCAGCGELDILTFILNQAKNDSEIGVDFSMVYSLLKKSAENTRLDVFRYLLSHWNEKDREPILTFRSNSILNDIRRNDNKRGANNLINYLLKYKKGFLYFEKISAYQDDLIQPFINTKIAKLKKDKVNFELTNKGQDFNVTSEEAEFLLCIVKNQIRQKTINPKLLDSSINNITFLLSIPSVRSCANTSLSGSMGENELLKVAVSENNVEAVMLLSSIPCVQKAGQMKQKDCLNSSPISSPKNLAIHNFFNRSKEEQEIVSRERVPRDNGDYIHVNM